MLRQPGFRRVTAGFTVIETLIAITLLTIGVVSLAMLVSGGSARS